jgi:adenylate cyclase class 2
MIENEIKIKLTAPELKELIKNLISLKAKKEFCVKQVTNRFDTASKDLEARGVFLRTRLGEINTLTLKRKISKVTGPIRSREELEINAGGKDQILILNKIIRILGFAKCIIMEKYRMQWFFDSCEIAIDELDFGFYVEIEGAKDKIFKVAKKLKLNGAKSLTGTYWDLFREHNKKQGITGQESIKFSSNYASLLMKLNNKK